MNHSMKQESMLDTVFMQRSDISMHTSTIDKAERISTRLSRMNGNTASTRNSYAFTVNVHAASVFKNGLTTPHSRYFIMILDMHTV